MVLMLPTRALAAIAFVALAGLVFLATQEDAPTPAPRAAPPTTSPAAPLPEAPRLPAPNPPNGVADVLQELFAPDDPAWAWSRVDLDALREAMPDNAFWTLAAPTDDPAVLDARRAAREAQNRAWGRILSNDAPEADIRAFYADRQRESSDLVSFTTRLLDDYGAALPDRDRGLVELSRRMHRQRLEELPLRLQEALDRREAHVDAVAAWKADQALFNEADSRDDAAD
ncbi:MAG: hypothetical protein AAGC67_15505 [Myxococcota bacterium]